MILNFPLCFLVPVIALTNFASGEIEISDGAAVRQRLPRDQANRLAMHARMHSVAEFVEELPKFLKEPEVREAILGYYGRLATPTDRWNFKEAFARLRTLTPEAPAGKPTEVVETIVLQPLNS